MQSRTRVIVGIPKPEVIVYCKDDEGFLDAVSIDRSEWSFVPSSRAFSGDGKVCIRCRARINEGEGGWMREAGAAHDRSYYHWDCVKAVVDVSEWQRRGESRVRNGNVADGSSDIWQKAQAQVPGSSYCSGDKGRVAIGISIITAASILGEAIKTAAKIVRGS